jgi:Peptidase S46
MTRIRASLTKPFAGTKGVCIMIPPNVTSLLVHAFQRCCTAKAPTGWAPNSSPANLQSRRRVVRPISTSVAIRFRRVGRPKCLTFRSIFPAVLVILLAFCCFTRLSQADEGMWTFNNFPSQKVQAKYGFAPSQSWLDHVRESSLRIAEGCTASFISPNGLVMTNHHCVVECEEQLSTAQENFVETGFSAKNADEERKCPDFELDQLSQIEDVTTQVKAALADKIGDAANKALRAEQARLQQTCGTDPSIRCDLVSLYHGGVYNLYHYKRYTDVRLVFAPEFAVAQFGGDPDNFNFPRFDFDIGLLRAYESGQPAASHEYLRWSPDGSKAGELVFVSGNPGASERELTISQLEFLRDDAFPHLMPFLAEYRGLLEEFRKLGPEQARAAREDEFFVANSFKANYGRQAALLDPQFFATKVVEEQKLRAAVADHPKLAEDASAWNDIAEIQQVRKEVYTRYADLNGYLLRGGLIGDAIELVRAAAERTKPNSERLPEYTDQALITLRQRMAARIPVNKNLQQLTLAYFVTTTRRDLGEGDPFVRKMLGDESPAQLADRLISGTHLDDPKVRESLYDGGEAAISTSSDPLIRFAALIDPDLRAARKEYEDQVVAPTRSNAERIAIARFAVYGTSLDPDATFTLRLSYGTVKGFEDAHGHFVEPYTTIGGLFHHATGAPPFALPKSWLQAKSSLNMETPMNVSTTNDIIGGNSGSPLINSEAQIVGLIFDGNIFSLGGDFGYDAARNRAVAVDSRALLEGLQNVYHLDRIVNEINAAR